MAVRVGGAPSESAWLFFDRTLNTSWGTSAKPPSEDKPKRKPNPVVRAMKDFAMQLIGLHLGYLLPVAVVLTFGLPAVLVIVFFLNIERMNSGVGGLVMFAILIALGIAWFFVMERIVSDPDFPHSISRKARGVLTNPLVKQAQRGTFNGINEVPHALPYARALFERQQRGLELENMLPFDVQIAHDIELNPGRSSNLIRVAETEVRAVNPIAFTRVDSAASATNPDPNDRFLRALVDEARSTRTLPVGHIISTRGGVVVADVKYWRGTLTQTSKHTLVDHALGLEELSRHRSVTALAEAGRFINGGDVALILVIVVGGKVEGGQLETRMKGFPVVVAEWEEAMSVLHHLDAKKNVEPVSIDTILENSPVA